MIFIPTSVASCVATFTTFAILKLSQLFLFLQLFPSNLTPDGLKLIPFFRSSAFYTPFLPPCDYLWHLVRYKSHTEFPFIKKKKE